MRALSQRTFDEVPEGGEAVDLRLLGPPGAAAVVATAAIELLQLLPSADRVDDDSFGGSSGRGCRENVARRVRGGSSPIQPAQQRSCCTPQQW